MNDLRRSQAPFPQATWQVIDEEIRSVARQMLAARRIVDFAGPLGWETAAIGTGRIEALTEGPGDGVEAGLRQVRRLVELRAPFELTRVELDAIARGARDPDLSAATEAARNIASAEDRAIFHGYAAAELNGICDAAAGRAVTLDNDYENFPRAVAQALDELRNAGIGGPYAIVLGSRCFTGLTQTTVGGFPVIAHVQRLIEREAIWAPALDGAIVVSRRGGDFTLTLGRDLSVGYADHTESEVALFIQESFVFEVITPEAAVPLRYGETAARE